MSNVLHSIDEKMTQHRKSLNWLAGAIALLAFLGMLGAVIGMPAQDLRRFLPF